MSRMLEPGPVPEMATELDWALRKGWRRAVGHLEDEGGWSLQRNHLGDSQGKGRAGNKGAQGGSRWSGEPWGAGREALDIKTQKTPFIESVDLTFKAVVRIRLSTWKRIPE